MSGSGGCTVFGRYGILVGVGTAPDGVSGAVLDLGMAPDGVYGAVVDAAEADTAGDRR